MKRNFDVENMCMCDVLNVKTEMRSVHYMIRLLFLSYANLDYYIFSKSFVFNMYCLSCISIDYRQYMYWHVIFVFFNVILEFGTVIFFNLVHFFNMFGIYLSNLLFSMCSY